MANLNVSSRRNSGTRSFEGWAGASADELYVLQERARCARLSMRFNVARNTIFLEGMQ